MVLCPTVLPKLYGQGRSFFVLLVDNFCCLKFANNLDKGFDADRPYAQPDLLLPGAWRGNVQCSNLPFVAREQRWGVSFTREFMKTLAVFLMFVA